MLEMIAYSNQLVFMGRCVCLSKTFVSVKKDTKDLHDFLH